MDKVVYYIHHQAVADCPKCGQMHVEDLGEDSFAEGIEIECICGHEFELTEGED